MITLIKALKLCLVTHIQNIPLLQYQRFLQTVIRGGVSMVQLREKAENEAELSEIRYKARILQPVLKALKIPFIINDFVELAAELDADGVHLGSQDMEVKTARKILGPNKIIGLSIESMDELYLANAQKDINYVTASALFPSKTKKDCKKIWGIADLAKLVSESVHPITAIGGINRENIKNVCETNVHGVAVTGAIQNALDPYQAAKALNHALSTASCHHHPDLYSNGLKIR